VEQVSAAGDSGTTMARVSFQAWDAAPVKLGWRRIGSRWEATGTGFEAHVEPVGGGAKRR
jgi:hypothetical protein